MRALQEGEVGAGNKIVKVGEASQRMTVAEIDALLSRRLIRESLQRALTIDARSPGWRASSKRCTGPKHRRREW